MQFAGGCGFLLLAAGILALGVLWFIAVMGVMVWPGVQ
jgi:hypothetical protein